MSNRIKMRNSNAINSNKQDFLPNKKICEHFSSESNLNPNNPKPKMVKSSTNTSKKGDD